jgi:pyridoxal phosphate enzyme (YggS family)
VTRGAAIAENLAEVRTRIARACAGAGRSPAEVRLLAVSKTVAPEAIVAALAAGQVDFAENYGQEFRDKVGAVEALLAAHPGLPRPRWHFIGPLQTNKVKYVAGKVETIHTIADLGVLAEVERQCASRGTIQDCLVQVNVAGEAQKSGLAPGALPALLDAFARFPHCRCQGLMVIPPYDPEAERSRPHFQALRRLRDEHAAPARPHVDLRHLSMGMSHDVEVAIDCGATFVRVGTAIFGDRA